MNLDLDSTHALKYKSSSQIARVITESWVASNSYCPSCGNPVLAQFKNNRPVADFYCNVCNAEYELKSGLKPALTRINDGAYATMMQRIHAENNPSFFFLNYSLKELRVLNYLVIPKHYFVDEIIERRSPLGSKAKRAGWTGCNILLQNIPSSGRIYLVRNGAVEPQKSVLEALAQTSFLANERAEKRGWTIEILKLLDRIPKTEFVLDDVYKFESALQLRFPANNFIRDKIRQQLQVLRDKGVIEFCGRGRYRKLLQR